MQNFQSPNKFQIAEPTDAQLLSLVGERPLISLQELAAALWPLLLWESAARDDLMMLVASDRTVRVVPPAFWLRWRCQKLIHAGELRLGPMSRRRAGIAGLTYRLPGSLPPVLLQEALAQEVAHG